MVIALIAFLLIHSMGIPGNQKSCHLHAGGLLIKGNSSFSTQVSTIASQNYAILNVKSYYILCLIIPANFLSRGINDILLMYYNWTKIENLNVVDQS